MLRQWSLITSMVLNHILCHLKLALNSTKLKCNNLQNVARTSSRLVYIFLLAAAHGTGAAIKIHIIIFNRLLFKGALMVWAKFFTPCVLLA